LFVVLLVIVSMLNAAAIVVFVNKAEPVKSQLDALGSQLTSAQHEAAANLTAMDRAEAQYNTEVQLHLKDNKDNAAASAGLQDQVNKDSVAIAQLQAQNTDLQTTLATAQSNVQISASTSAKDQDTVAQFRTANDTLAKQNGEISQHNSELTSTLEALQARQEETQEQLADAKTNIDKLSGYIKNKGGDPQQVISADVGALSAPDIQGQISETSVINGNTFVTINVGSADGVAKGMKFDVVNGPDFLGIVTIDTVDTDNAIGRLESVPGKENMVHAGAEVKTQIRGS
jgi:myosin heavy subunit